MFFFISLFVEIFHFMVPAQALFQGFGTGPISWFRHRPYFKVSVSCILFHFLATYSFPGFLLYILYQCFGSISYQFIDSATSFFQVFGYISYFKVFAMYPFSRFKLHPFARFRLYILYLKGVFAKNERGYRLHAIKKRF